MVNFLYILCEILIIRFQNLKAKAEIAEREKIIMKNELTNNKSSRDTNDNAIDVLGQGDTALQKCVLNSSFNYRY